MNKEISIASQFVPYELSLKLKNIGFNEECLARYWVVTEWEKLTGEVRLQLFLDASIEDKFLIKAPTWQQAFDWFREKHNLHALNSPLLNNEWSVVIDNTLNSKQVYWSKRVGYQEARKACLEKLIEICKNHQCEI